MFEVESSGTYGARLVVTAPFQPGERICTIDSARIVPTPTYQTIQVGVGKHLEELGVVAYMNHSCQPNTIIDTSIFSIVATRDIAPGDDLTFFYPSTEWEMDRPFICLCGSPQCVRFVAGAKYLSIDVLGRYFINQHIRDLAHAALSSAELFSTAASYSVHPHGVGGFAANGTEGFH